MERSHPEVYRQSFGVHDCADAALFADVPQVGRESVADVDHGGRQLFLAQELSHGHSRLRIEVLGMRPRPEFLSVAKLVQSSDCRAQRSCHINEISRSRARAQDGFSRRNRTEDHDVGQDAVGRLRRVASSQRNRILRLPASIDPATNLSTQLCGRSGGSASERNAQRGIPPMAAMSLNPRARQR